VQTVVGNVSPWKGIAFPAGRLTRYRGEWSQRIVWHLAGRQLPREVPRELPGGLLGGDEERARQAADVVLDSIAEVPE
jgi:hypothetical protein